MYTLRYRDPDSTQTLREGIAELRAAEGADDDAAQNVAPDLVGDIDVHDAIHVLFACSTDLPGEIIAHVWTAFGTTVQVGEMRRVNEHNDHREVLAKIGHGHLFRVWAAGVPRAIATLVRAARMKRRWPAEDWQRFLDQRLLDIREDFGIRLPAPSPARTHRAGAALRTIRAPLRGDARV